MKCCVTGRENSPWPIVTLTCGMLMPGLARLSLLVSVAVAVAVAGSVISRQLSVACWAASINHNNNNKL